MNETTKIKGWLIKDNFLDALDDAVEKYPDKSAFISENATVTYKQVQSMSVNVGTYLAQRVKPLSTVAIFMERDVYEPSAIFGVIQAGCISAPLYSQTPAERVLKVFETLKPDYIIIDSGAQELIKELGDDLPCPVVTFDEAAATKPDEEKLATIRMTASSIDPIIIYYTSGSTGMPKGVVHTHRSILGYTSRAITFTDVLNDHQVYGNQAPFFYAHGVNDMFISLVTGSTVRIIPNECFLFPESLLSYFQEYKITTTVMTPMNYIYVADAGILTPGCLPDLESVYMSGEVVPYEKMRMWADAAPRALILNIYGSTESPYCAEFFLMDKVLPAGSLAPVGFPIDGVRILLLDENGDEAAYGDVGEVYVTSPWLSSGYFRDPEQTAKHYVNDPLGYGWNQIYFRSGDLGRYNEKGELQIQGRKDTQIKHRGYRMDIAEVDGALRTIEGWQNGCCLFSENEDLLYLFWCGDLEKTDIQKALKGKLETYMHPNVYVKLEDLPRTASGKMDRMTLKKEYFGKK